MSSKKILILGANGFVGTHLTNYLSKQGYDVTVLVRRQSNFSMKSCKNIRILYGDLLKENVLRKALQDIDVVYDLAGIGLNRIKRANAKDVSFNQDSALCLAKAVAESGRTIKMIYLSTIKVNRPAEKASDMIHEGLSYANWDKYGWSKAQAEKILIRYAEKYRIRTVILRAPLILGENDKNCQALFNMRKWPVKLKLTAKKIPFASFVDVNDLCRIMEHFIEMDTDKCIDILNVAHKETININLLIDEIFRRSPKKYVTIRIHSGLLYCVMRVLELLHIKPLIEPERVKDLSEYRWVCDTSKLNNKYHLVCNTDLKESINRIVGE